MFWKAHGIAGNPPKDRIARLQQFWERVSSGFPLVVPAPFDLVRMEFNRWSASSSMAFGVPGFFSPRVPPPQFNPDGTPGALSIYDTSPLRDTLRELVSFDLINERKTRFSVGAVDVRSGNSVYFDNDDPDLIFGPQHVMASGALPPGLPPVKGKDVAYWDGGLVSNSPLWYVLDDCSLLNALVLRSICSARGAMPRNLDQVLERAKDIQYSSKTRFNTSRAKRRGAAASISARRRSCRCGSAATQTSNCWPSARAPPRVDRPPDQPPLAVLVAIEGLRVLARDDTSAVGGRPCRHAQDAGEPRLAPRMQSRARDALVRFAEMTRGRP